jgi:hypothetical protein
VPEITNPNTKIILEQLGPFKYESDPEMNKECAELPTLSPYELDSGAIYIGQWKLGNRHGKGKQVSGV